MEKAFQIPTLVRVRSATSSILSSAEFLSEAVVVFIFESDVFYTF